MKQIRLPFAVVFLLCTMATIETEAITGTMIFATTNNTVNAISPLSAWNSGSVPDATVVDTDNLWSLRSFATNHWESYVPTEDSPLLKTTVTGLAFSNYIVRVIYLGIDNPPIAIAGVQAGLSPSSLTLYTAAEGAVAGTGFPPFSLREVVLGVVQDTTSFSVYVDDLAGLSLPAADIRGEYVGVSYEATAVPEPTGLALALFGASIWRLRSARRG